jgi:asparagine synthase (glutamine-hydrolysing)
MCGIAGIINYKGYDLKKLQDKLFHRGPDQQDIFIHDNTALVHTRLAIVDVESGLQPMHHGDYSIVFNGEIYNHQKLHAVCNNFIFSGKSDTEVLLALYSLYGKKLFQYLDGMFAFAVSDRKKNSLFLARDRAGKKPLYYTTQNGSFIFASELNALKSVCNPEINEQAIAAYVRAGFFQSPITPYKDVYELEPGHWLQIDTDSLHIKKESYFSVSDTYLKNDNTQHILLSDAIEELDYALDLSVKDRMLSSDIEVGAFLSGGIDSSLIVAKASQYCANLKTFTVSFDGAYDESALARLVADKYKTDHKQIKISVNLKQDIEKILLAYGKPFADSSAIPSYYVSKAAKEYVTVILNGDGADEIFGGYRRYVPVANHWLNKVRYFSFIRHMLPKPDKKRSYYNYLYRLLDAASKKPGLDWYISLTTDSFEGFERHLRKSSLLPALDEKIKKICSDKLTSLSAMLCLDFTLLLPCNLLQKMDIATMVNSLEGRSPFLSKYILDFAPCLPDNFKINGTNTKFILRKLAKKYLPEKLINQPKRGFEVPLKSWVENDLKEIISDRLLPGCYSENFVDKKFLTYLVAKKISVSDEKRARMLWTLFCLEVWKANQ